MLLLSAFCMSGTVLSAGDRQIKLDQIPDFVELVVQSMRQT